MNFTKDKLLSAISYIEIINILDPKTTIDIYNIYTNSSEVVKNSIFIAIKGGIYDGHQFIDKAIDNGAIVIICSNPPQNTNNKVLYIVVRDTKEALYSLIDTLYAKELKKLQIIGITGTNGKTTTSTLAYQLFRHLNYKVGLISTIDIQIDGKTYPTKNTTPDILSLNKFLYKMVESGCDYAFMEVSSHALVQDRVKNINFQLAALTNITHDHLDYHKTFNSYIQAKKLLFDNLSNSAIALVNKDDKHSDIMLQNTKAVKKTYALHNLADFKARIVEKGLDGMQLSINDKEVWVKLSGCHNAYNILLLYSIAMLLGQNQNKVLENISKLNIVKGRFDISYLHNGVITIIDYAHTPDGVKKILEAINDIKQKQQRIITVIGAGGDRDNAKRPKMANYAYMLSSHLILTSDNPRNEDPQKIVNDMLKGLPNNYDINTEIIIDREQAIVHALKKAEKNDIVVILGKGHEQYIDIKGKKIQFCEPSIIEKFNNNLQA